MVNKKQSVEFICNKLLSTNQITQIEYDTILNKYSENTGVSLLPSIQVDKTNSTMLNDCLIQSAIDISTLFNSSNSVDLSIDKFRRLNESIINSINLRNKKNLDEIHLIKNKLRSKNIYNYYETFRDSSAIADDFEYKYTKVYFDKYVEALRLDYNNSINTLLSKDGNRLGSIEILKQYSSSFSTYVNKYISLNNIIDSSLETYWHECIEVDDPIELDYNSNVTDLKHGAVCELLFTLPSITEVNEINILPMCEYPLEVVEISYSIDNVEFIPLVFNIINEPINKYLTNKSSNKVFMYQFKSINAKFIKVVLNQIHYGINHFISKEENLLINGIFIKQDNKELVDRLFKPINTAIFDTDLNVGTRIDNKVSNLNKLQYEYGLYNVAILNNEYSSSSEFISNNYQFPGLSTITLKVIDEQFEIGISDIYSTTSIEYDLIINNNEELIYPILPSNKSKVEYELLKPWQDETSNNVYANTRFNMNLLDIGNNIKIYRGNKLLNSGYSIIDNRTLELTEYDPYSNYTITYILDNLKQNTHLKLPTFTERIELIDVRVRAIFRQNSKDYTEITPILHEYEIYATEVPVPVGEYNDLMELKIVPFKSYTNVPYDIPIFLSSKPILLDIQIMQDPIIIDVIENPNTNELEAIDIIEVDEYIE